MKVYEFKGFPNPARVRIALAEKGLFENAEFVQVDVTTGEHLTPEFLAKNPSAVVPVLELEDGTTISESSAITEYLDHIAGEPDLTGKTAKDRAVIAIMQRKVEAGLLDAIGAYFHIGTDGLGPQVENYHDEAWGERQKGNALQTMEWMNSILADQPYLAGDHFSVADITAMAGFAFADFVALEIPERCAHLHAWRARVSERPSAALAA